MKKSISELIESETFFSAIAKSQNITFIALLYCYNSPLLSLDMN